MDILILVVAMVVVGLIMGVVAGAIWKDNRPIGVRGDYIVSVISAVVMGFIDWYLIPAMGFSDTLRWVGVILEPPLASLLVLWIIRMAKK
jgi:uncharacterized membrane protein YeaQ/YmgE (transglycosylase-associated protein family)